MKEVATPFRPGTFSLVLASLAFSRGSISTPPTPTGWAWAQLSHTPSHGAARPSRLPAPLWAGRLEENSPQAFFKTGNCSPCFLKDRNCPHGNHGTKRPLNPSKGRPGLELLLTFF